MESLAETNTKPILLKFGNFLFTIVPNNPLILPAYKGSTFRGGFGSVFKRLVCIAKNNECAVCFLKEKCAYSYIFETPPPPGTEIMRKYEATPHPFVIEPPPEKRRGYKPGDEIKFGLILIGKAIEYLPYFIYTFDELGRTGITKDKTKYELKNVSCNGEKIYDSETKTLKSFKTSSLILDNTVVNDSDSEWRNMTISLSFLTPARILYDGRLTLDLEFHILIRNLLRRLSLLYYFHCNGDPSGWNFNGLIEKSKNIKVKENKLRWYRWKRYSARQNTKINMGGFVGEITFEGKIEPFIPIIKAGEVLHIGKGTGFGLGKYSIQNSKLKIQDTGS